MKLPLILVGILSSMTLLPANVSFADGMVRTGFKASNLIGEEVRNKQGKDLGAIHDLVLNGNGSVGYVVLSHGGFLGMGDKYFAVPWKALMWTDDRKLILDVPEDRLDKMPGFEKDNWPELNDQDWALMVHEFYAIPYPAAQASAGKREIDELQQHAHFSARQGYLVGGEGKTGNSMRYDGTMIWEGPSYAVVDVDPQDNAGMVLGIVRSHDHTYTIIMTAFKGEADFMNGGIATDLMLHGTTEQGGPIFPKVKAYVAGWGTATVFKDDDVLYKQFPAHFMLTEGVRDEATHKIHFVAPERLKVLMESGQDGRLSAEVAEPVRKGVEEARRYVNPHTMQLHVVAHSTAKDEKNLPPFDQFIHFMFDHVSLEDSGHAELEAAQSAASRR